MTAVRPPAWAWVVVAWALLVAGAALIELRWGLELETCLLRRATGVPCPTCGSTRSVLAALRGDFLGSLRASPLLWVAGLGLAGFTAQRLVRGAGDAGRPGLRTWQLLLGLALLLANWAWVLAQR